MKRYIWGIIIPLFSLLSVACSSESEPAFDHYVSSSAELVALESSGKLRSGDVVAWRNGTYTNEQLEFTTDGVTLCAERSGEVIFTGTSRIVVKGNGQRVQGFVWRDLEVVAGKSIIYLGSGSERCVVDSCVIDGESGELSLVDTKWVSLYGTRHIIQRSTFLDKKNMGTTLVVWFEDGVTPKHTIRDNYFTRPHSNYEGTTAMNGQETIRIGTGDFAACDGLCTVTGNHFHNCHGEMAEIISNKSCKNYYEGNLFTDSAGTLTIRQGNDCVVTNNYFISSSSVERTGGVRVIGKRNSVTYNYMEGLTGTSGYTSGICTVRGIEADADGYSLYPQVEEALISGNLLVDCACAITSNYGASDYDQPVITTEIKGNMIISNSSASKAINHYDNNGPDITYSDNIIWGGQQVGVSLPTVEKKPYYSRPTATIEAIKSWAGAKYYR